MKVMNFATTRVITIAPNDSIDRAIRLMEERDIHHLVVVSDGHVVGMVSDRDILISTGWMYMSERRSKGETGARARVVGPTHIAQIMSRPVMRIREQGSVQNAARLMLNRRIGALPVLRNQEVVGILSEWDLARWLSELTVAQSAAGRFLEQEVCELMDPNVASVEPEDPIDEVISLFRQLDIHHLPVAIDSVLLGIISDRDVRRALGWSFIQELKKEATRHCEINGPFTAQEIMQADVRTVGLTDSLDHALKLMLTHRIHSLPVVLRNQLLGILTLTDFVRAIADDNLLSMNGLLSELIGEIFD